MISSSPLIELLFSVNSSFDNDLPNKSNRLEGPACVWENIRYFINTQNAPVNQDKVTAQVHDGLGRI